MPTTPQRNDRLRQERMKRNWRQQDVAERLGISVLTVKRWERGSHSPSAYYRAKLCLLFESNAEELGLLDEEGGEAKEAPPLTLRTEETSTLSTHADILSPGASTRETPGTAEAGTLSTQTVEKANPPSAQTQTPLSGACAKEMVSRRTMVLSLGLAAAITAGGVILWRNWRTPRTVPLPPAPLHPLLSTYHTHPPTSVNDVAWSPQKTVIACANGDKTVQIVEAATGWAIVTYRNHRGFVNSVSWSPDQQFIASASADATVQIWNPTSGAQIFTYHGHTAAVWCVAWSPDGTCLASSGRNPAVLVWDARTGKLISAYHGHTKGVWMVAWSPDSQSIASCGEDGTIQVWEALTGRKSDTFQYEGNQKSTLYEVAWSPDGKRLASASADTTVQVWDALTGGHMLTCSGHTNSVQTVKWSPDGTLLASGSLDNTVRTWNALTGNPVELYPYHTDEVYAVSWAPDGHLLASGSKDTTMQVYRVPQG